MDNRDSNLSGTADASGGGASSPWTVARQWRESVRYFGFWRALWKLAGSLYGSMIELLPSRRRARFGDLDYDWENSVDTTRATVAFSTQLLTGLTARPYYASEPWLFEQIMQAIPDDLSQFTFVDLGSGKGRVLLMASDYPFRRIVGVELVTELHRVAQKNIANYSSERRRCAHIEAVWMDARDFQFPSEPLVVYLFNPFAEPTFAQVLGNLKRAMEQATRPIYIAYRFTEFETLLAKASWLEKVAGAEQWAVYQNRRDRK